MANLTLMSFDAATATAVVTGVIIGLLGVIAARNPPKPAPVPVPARRPPSR